jgi:hypothetical protein
MGFFVHMNSWVHVTMETVNLFISPLVIVDNLLEAKARGIFFIRKVVLFCR